MSCCTHDCNEGRECVSPVALHRVPFLRTRNGGETVDTDEPITTPEKAEGWTLPVLWSVGFFALACLIAAVCYGVQLQFPF